MIPLVLTCGVFLYWIVLGRAVLALCCRGLGVLRSWLIAPGVGFATLGIFLACLNQAGLPIKVVAWPLSFSLLALALWIIWIRQIKLPIKTLLPFLGAILFLLLWSSWPMLRFGFHWLSYVNDDFANYCLSAEKFKDFGFYKLPTKEELYGTDYSQYYWFMHAIQLMRFGSEHAVAWLSSLTGKASLEVFMPTIMAFTMAQSFAAAALVLAKGKYKSHALWTSVLLSFSPMFLFGSLYQLIAQVSGVCLLLCLIVLLTTSLRTRKRRKVLIHAIATSIVGAALCIFYPEVTPFAALSVGLYVCIKWVRMRILPGAEIVLLEYTIIGVLIILRHNAISYLYTLANQLVGGTRAVDLSLSLFPFFLIPSGLASIFGLQAMNQDLTNPWASIVIFAGFLLLINCIIFAFKQTYKGSAVGCLLIVELGFAALLYRSGNDFGLYKIVMFTQPLLMAALACTFISINKRYALWILSLGLFGLTASTALIYTRGSIGAGGGMTGEVSLASQLIAHRPKAPDKQKHWVSDIDNVSAAKLVAGFYRGTDISFICRDYFYPVFLPRSDWPYVKYFPNWKQFDQAVDIMTERTKSAFVVKPLYGTTFSETVAFKKTDAYLGEVSELSLFNKITQSTAPSDSLLILSKPGEVKNRLAFIHSEKGNQYYLGDRRKISYFQQEDDYFGNHSYFNGIGQFMLLRIENPSPMIYLRISATKTLMGNGHTAWSPGAAILADNRLSLGAVGSGAINLIVGPLKPVWLDGEAYVAIDFNQTAISLPTRRTWLKALYNSNINLDYRRLVGFGRDISALSPEEFNTLDRPRGLGRFPADIVSARGLEYSGIYEDGWISPDAHFVLAGPEAKDQIRIKGFIPDLPGISQTQELTICLNNKFHYTVSTRPGEFDWAIPVPANARFTQLDIHSESHAVLPDLDARPVAAKLTYIGLESKETYSFDYSKSDLARPIANHIGSDGWSSASSEITIPVARATKSLILKIEYPGWNGIAMHAVLKTYDQSNHLIVATLNQGLNQVVIPCANELQQMRLHFKSDQVFTLPAPDARSCSFRLLSITPTQEK